MNSVTLINPFIVPIEQEAETIAMWEKARDFLAGQPGYIQTRLHRSLRDDATYLLVNVAEWTSAEAFKAASQRMRVEAGLPMVPGVVSHPGLYRVIAE